MRWAPRNLLFTSLLAGLLIAAYTGRPLLAETAQAAELKSGKDLAFDAKKGNCLACHAMDDGISPGTVGPKLISMEARFPDRKKLAQQIWDARANNPHTLMPPFGKHRILTEKEIDQIVDYLYTL